ncbi:MAG: potassium/proton antiporter [Anaerolineae bacterium]|nr:potassium/proton antiporter [Anaerolineae bacterium]
MQVYVLLMIAALLLISVFASKISDRFGIPALLLFLALGMLAGSEGPGGVYFDNPSQAQGISIIALVLILFSGGLQTGWDSVRPVVKFSLPLATFGVFITAIFTGVLASVLLDLTIPEGILLGSIVSSTDAAAVFSVLRSRGISLRKPLKPLLELESGSNDPMAIFLTVGMIQLITHPDTSFINLVTLFLQQMLIGALAGILMGRLGAIIINRIKLGYEGLYPVLSLSLVLLTFGVTDFLNGSGFLAVYIMGIVLNHIDVVHKRSLQRFHDGLAWLMQIIMFLALGLFVFPSRLLPTMGISLVVALLLIFVARPLAVFLTLLPSRMGWRQKTFISWVGLRGAAPIILATFPMLAGIPQADLIFNVIFFVVLTSVLIQGTTLPFIAKFLHLDAPSPPAIHYPIEYEPVSGMKSDLNEVFVPSGSNMANKAIVDLHLPDPFLIILIARNHEFLTPHGGMILLPEDTLLILSDVESLEFVKNRFDVLVR